MSKIQIARALRLMTLLRAKSARRPKDLAAELEVSERTVYRDLGVLATVGMSVRFDPESGGYQIGGDFFLPPVQLTVAEALALSVLGSQIARQGQVPFLTEAWQAVTKVRSQLPAAMREEVAGADGRITVQAARVSPQEGCGEYFETFRRAIASTRKVRCRYDGGHADGAGPFLFRPYSLFFNQRAWYVIGHSELRDAERSFKLNRFGKAEATQYPYMIPGGWTLEKFLGKAWRMMRGRRYAVAVRFDREAGRNMADTLWHATQTIEWEPDGSCLFRCEVDGLDEIVWWVLGYGPHAKVIAPVELRDKVCELAEGTCGLYDGEPKRPGSKSKYPANRRRGAVVG